MNYGRRLAFGMSLAPDVGTAAAAGDLAQRAEALGIDLVVVHDDQDQPPGQAAGLDTWTLLSFVAARTATIELAAPVAAVTALNPAVLAHAAGSLDLLSGGRLNLMVAADADAGCSAAVDALRELIEVVEAVLDAGEPGTVRHLGTHYTIPNAARGPLPAHRIPLWLRGSDEAVLRLAGQRADGWVSTLADFAPGGLAAANKILDEAAEQAGRAPAEIRRILTVPADLGVPALLALVVQDGIDTLVVQADDPGALQGFSEQTIPALRAAVARELPEPLTGVVRGSAVRAKRRVGIDYDAVPASLAGNAVEPGDVDYIRVRSTYMRGGSPGLVLRPRTTAEVVDALAFVRAHPGLPFGVRSGGHGVSGRSTNDGGIVISLAAMNGVEVLDEGARLVRIGPGAIWMDVAAALAPYGWALSSGDYGGVGVGGLATAGGIGWLVREQGLTIDHLRAAEVVLADGTVVRTSDTENPDLFWAVRGAGANFGVVTSFDFEVDEVGDVGFAQLVVGADDPADLLVRWGAAIEAAPRTLSGEIIIGRPRRGQPGVAQLMAVVDSDQPEEIIEALQPIAAVGPLYQQNVMLIPYAGVVANAADGYHQGQGEPVSRSGLLEHLTPEFAAAAARLLASGAVYWFQIRTVGGAVSDIAPDATAYAHRSANFALVVMGADARRVDAAWAEVHRHVDGLYLSFETDRSPERLTEAFPPATLARLRALKGRYDPGSFFRDNFTIDPTAETTIEPTVDPTIETEDRPR